MSCPPVAGVVEAAGHHLVLAIRLVVRSEECFVVVAQEPGIGSMGTRTVVSVVEGKAVQN